MKSSFLFCGLLALGCFVSGCASHQDVTPQLLSPALTSVTDPTPAGPFVRVSQIAGEGKVAEIVAASRDGKTLIYNDATGGNVGFVDVTDPANPQLKGLLTVGEEPTSLALTRDDKWGLVCIRDKSVTGKSWFVVFDFATHHIVRRLPLSGQPDCLKISADNRYAVIAIENERTDMDKPMPQAPPGNVTIVDLTGPPDQWKLRVVPVINLPVRFPTDPEPEYITINAHNEAAVSLQENNGVCIVDLKSGRVIGSWSCGITQHAADLKKDGKIDFSDTLRARREPDSLAWTPQGNIITANEGDYDFDETDFRAGGRDFTLFNRQGKVLWDSANQLDELAAKSGAYNDKRSPKRGTEPEGVAIAAFGNKTYAFIGCERAHGVAVYDLSDETNPKCVQWLDTGERPEEVLALPTRNLVITANEGDNTLSVFQMK